MGTTLVGVFDDINDALEARDKLRASGVAEEAMRIEAESAAATQARSATFGARAAAGGAAPAADALDSSGTSVSPLAESAGTGLPTGPGTHRRGFFAEFFGLGDADETPGHYAEAVRRGGTVLTVDVVDDERIADVIERMENCGAIDIDERVEKWRAAGYSGHDASAPAYTPEQVQAERGQVLGVVEEDLKVGKRTVESGRVRVHRRVTETPVEQTVTLREERAVVDRHAVDRPATPADLQAFNDPAGQTIELRESSEETVVSKTARVVEEVRVGTEASERTETVRDTVRRSDVEVERIDAGAAGSRFAPASITGTPGVEGVWTGYSGPERRVGTSGAYSGVERRAA